MNTEILISICIVLLILSFMNKKENFKLNFPENNDQLKCKCDLDNKEKLDRNKKKKNIETFANYDSSQIKPKKVIHNRNYLIYDPPNEINTAENFYLSKISEYPFTPLQINNNNINPANNKDYEDIGQSSSNILPKKFIDLESHKFSYGKMYEY